MSALHASTDSALRGGVLAAAAGAEAVTVVDGVVFLRVSEDEGAAERAESRAQRGEPLLVGDVVEVLADRVAIWGALTGGVERFEVSRVGGGSVPAVACDVEGAEGTRELVVRAHALAWGAIADYVGEGRREAGVFPWLGAVAVVAVVGGLAYVVGRVAPALVSAWSESVANDVRVKEVIRLDARLAELTAAHVEAEKAAGRQLPISDAVAEEARSLTERAALLSGRIDSFKGDGESLGPWWPWVLAGAATVVVALVMQREK